MYSRLLCRLKALHCQNTVDQVSAMNLRLPHRMHTKPSVATAHALASGPSLTYNPHICTLHFLCLTLFAASPTLWATSPSLSATFSCTTHCDCQTAGPCKAACSAPVKWRKRLKRGCTGSAGPIEGTQVFAVPTCLQHLGSACATGSTHTGSVVGNADVVPKYAGDPSSDFC